ncbi:MAG: acyl-CoA thioesterase [Flavobacteriales bacterium]|nr:acyl-CoA thioesterase [Flavobacteriales bacterium]
MKHASEVELRFADIDALGHVNNAVYLSLLENARIRFFEAVIRKEIDWDSEGMILARAEINYKAPVYLHDKIVIYTWVSRLGNTSFDMSYSLVKKNGDQEIEVANAITVIVCFSYKTSKPVPIPEKWIVALNEYNG